jgi:hypothetical protein
VCFLEAEVQRRACPANILSAQVGSIRLSTSKRRTGFLSPVDRAFLGIWLLNGPVGCLVFSFAMQSRTPRLGWIARVLADSDAQPERAEQTPPARTPLRLVSRGTRSPKRSGIKPPTLVATVPDQKSGGPSVRDTEAGR